MTRLTLSIGSELADVSLIAVAINRVCVQLGLDEIRASEVELCVVEAITNVIRHSYHAESGHTVTIAVTVLADRLQLEVTDSGTPMNDEQAERLVSGEKPVDFDAVKKSTLSEGGRGLQIMHDLLDEITYTRTDTTNRLILVKRILPGHTS